MTRIQLTLAFAAASISTMTPAFAAHDDEVKFDLAVNPKFLNCLRGPEPEGPKATATVVRGKQNDTMTLQLRNFKPDLAFDLFTIQRSSLGPDGAPDVNFTNFGMAWYQSDIQVDHNGNADVSIRTILLDQIFGFDPAAALPPTNTFHAGFWFNNPQDAAACGFDVTKPTPFNGEHKAGPLAMISVPNPTSGLGPLCTS